ncbi:MAG: VWA domain-containing protein, partial [Gammaproteobacteria bacterium]
ALVILLDLSTSMRAADVTPSRLERARFKIKDLLLGRATGQTALVVFAAQPFVVTPLTDDVRTIDSQLSIVAPELMPRQGTDVALAVQRGVELLQQAGFDHGDLLLVTDGVADAAVQDAVSALGPQYRLSVLGVGTPAGSPIPRPEGGFVVDADGAIVVSRLAGGALTTLAQRGRGLYVTSTPSGDDVAALQAFLAQTRRAADATATDRVANQWREIGPWLLLPVLACAVLAFRPGALIVLALACGLGSAPQAARADWFVTPDQAGQRAFRAERFDDAANTFAQRDWRAASQYRAGRYADVVETLENARTPDALYNKGNALARLGRLDEAIATYEEVLKRDPAHADATYNRDLLQKMLTPEQPPEDQQQKKDDPQKSEPEGGDADENQGQQGDGERAAEQGGEDGQREPQDPSDEAERAAEQERRRQQRGNNQASPNAAGDESADDPQAEREAAEEAAATAEADPEKALATEQWLRQIPDDPGGLLRRKFLYQYGRRYGQEAEHAEPW